MWEEMEVRKGDVEEQIVVLLKKWGLDLHVAEFVFCFVVVLYLTSECSKWHVVVSALEMA